MRRQKPRSKKSSSAKPSSANQHSAKRASSTQPSSTQPRPVQPGLAKSHSTTDKHKHHAPDAIYHAAIAGAKCPNCISSQPSIRFSKMVPLLILRPFVSIVRCDSCLMYFYRVRLFGWLFRR